MGDMAYGVDNVPQKGTLQAWFAKELPAETVANYRKYGKEQTIIDEVLGPAFACLLLAVLFVVTMKPDLEFAGQAFMSLGFALYLFLAHVSYVLSRNWKISAYWLIGLPVALAIVVARM
tara:strand:- start:875 stop:1231 length:357 start_codon:yes stop_codon:yes gene_type:complete